MIDISPSLTVSATRLRYDGGQEGGVRPVPVEVPIGIVYGAVPFAVMMASPADIEDFVIGFSLTEGIIERAEDVRSIGVEREGQGLRVEVALVPARMSEHLSRKRSLSGRTGCGLCGVEDLNSLPASAPVRRSGQPISLRAIEKAMLDLEHHQPLNDLTRAVHGAAWFSSTGDFLMLREDVGRHNALDKLIGALAGSRVSPQTGFIVITSRCSFEMVEKAAAFGASLLVAVSAPTSLAIERARALGITLVAVARHDGAMLFAGELSDDGVADEAMIDGGTLQSGQKERA